MGERQKEPLKGEKDVWMNHSVLKNSSFKRVILLLFLRQKNDSFVLFPCKYCLLRRY